MTAFELSSPNGKIQITIQTGERLTYDVLVNGKPVLKNSTLALDIDHKVLGSNPLVKTNKTDAVDRVIQSPVPQKSAKIHEAYKELRLEMEGNYRDRLSCLQRRDRLQIRDLAARSAKSKSITKR